MHLSGTYWDPFRAQQLKPSQTDLSSSEMEAKTGEVLLNECPFQTASASCSWRLCTVLAVRRENSECN